MSSVLGFIKRNYRAAYPPGPRSAPDNLNSPKIRFGILGAAAIAPKALLIPALNHPEVEVYAVAARDEKRAKEFARKWNIPKVHASYQELIEDEDVDVIYNPLPVGLHYEWTMKALQKGKHVLLEKPSADTAQEVTAMFELAESKGLVLVEAFHYRFHPVLQRAKAIVDSNELGKILNVSATLVVPSGMFSPDDIRFDYDLGGGALMDVGCYTMNFIRYITSSDPVSVNTAVYEAAKNPKASPETVSKVDRMFKATLSMPNDVTATIHGDLAPPYRLGFIPNVDITAVIECESGTVEIYNWVSPTLYHTITITQKDDKGKKTTRKEKAYAFGDPGQGKGEDWWTTYRYQLEAFMDRLKGRQPQTWISKGDSVANIQWIENIYQEMGLGSRPKSTYVHDS
ncbi:NAD(P)-binding protein [Coprinopsis marcescibilis]|uniref:D-xylose 1-dehydrogenase (NADP(+), D-xylono-1,5-lactone-forming) n=1 Tax=Coprinopsis marcescibilis TaxID=230819 RepID=A0A5C3LCS5_COPMA|nr:NAD(P)-binding protein [Coprinopsis marcescibilis]